MKHSSFLVRAAVITVAVSAPLFALAHPKLLSAVPAVNSHVAAVPAAVRLTFQEPLEPALSKITVVHAGQHNVTLSAVTSDSADRKTLLASIKTPMGPGVYSVTWQAAGADGHPMRGTYTFTVDAAGAR